MKAITFFKRLIVLIYLTATFSCQREKVDTKAEGEKLMQVSREWSTAAAARDVEKTLSYWADNATVISAGEPDIKGKEAIREMVEGSLKNPSFKISWEPISAEVSESGDMGYLLENTKISFKDSAGTEQVQNLKSVTIWKKQEDGSWKNVVDVMSPTKLK